MATTPSDPLRFAPPAYPVFAPNQVLSHAHLNRLTGFLDAQTRLTRASLIGTGIACGLEVALEDGGPALTVSPGCGVTTEGYLIAENDTRRLTHYRRAHVGADDLPVDPSEMGTIYELFGSARPGDVLPEEGNPIVGFEEAQDETGSPLAKRLEGMVILLLLDVEDEERSNCIYDCDEAGVHRTLAVRVLALTARDAERIVRAGYDPRGEVFGRRDFDRVINRAYYMPTLRLRRFGYVANPGEASPRIDLSQITSLSAFREGWARVTGTARSGANPLEAIAEAYRRAVDLLHPFVAGFEPDSREEFERLEEELEGLWTVYVEGEKDGDDRSERGIPYGIQYLYDHLEDLIDAYEELREEAFDLIDDCLPPPTRFPRHLMLGRAGKRDECRPPVFRTRFSQPSMVNENGRRAERVRTLYARLRRLAGGFRRPREDGETEIRVTAARSELAPLGDRAIPFYYEPDRDLHRSWSPRRARTCRYGENRSYHEVTGPSPTPPVQLPRLPRFEKPVVRKPALDPRSRLTLRPITESSQSFSLRPWSGSWISGSGSLPIGSKLRPEAKFHEEDLLGRLDHADFFRIEGHVGRTFSSALGEIDELRSRFNLPFDVIGLKVSVLEGEDEIEIDYRVTDLELQYAPCREELRCRLREIEPESSEVRQALALLLRGLTPRDEDEERRSDEGGGSAREEQPEKETPIEHGSFATLVDLAEKPMFTRFEELYVVVFGSEEEKETPCTGCTMETLRGLVGAYRDRIEEIRRRLLFHTFAEEHPGLEHRAGVPRGGTFILAYVNEGEQRAIEEISGGTLAEKVAGLGTRSGFNVPKRLGAETGESGGGVFSGRAAPLEGGSATGGIAKFDKELERLGTIAFRSGTSTKEEGGISAETADPEKEESAGKTMEGRNVLKQRIGAIREATRSYFATREKGEREAAAALEKARTELKKVPGMERVAESMEGLLEREMAARTHVVVGDFCLPYICCSDGPTTSYVVARPQPIVLLESLEFCEDDEDTYPFILHPGGGRVLGPGVESTEEGYQFRPAHPDVQEVAAGQDGIRRVTVTYYAEGGMDTLTVAVRPVREARFTVVGLPDSGVICRGEEEVPELLPLRPEQEGGQFEAEGVELIEQDGLWHLPTAELEPGSTVKVTYSFSEGGDFCGGSSSRTITVGEAPDPGFSGLAEVYCQDDDPVSLEPAATGSELEHSFTGPGVEFNEERGAYLFDPARVDLAGSAATVTVVHRVTGPDDCPGRAEQTVTVHPRPTAAFGFETALPTPICVDPAAENVQYRLVPEMRGGTFRTEIEGETGETGLLVEGEETFFVPADVLPATGVTITYEIQSAPGCDARSSRTVELVEAPDASFSGLAVSYCVNDEPVELVPDASGQAVTSRFQGEGVSFSQERNSYLFDPSTIQLRREPREIGIVHTITHEAGCSSRRRKTVTVFPVPDAAFDAEPALPETICVGKEEERSYLLHPRTPGGRFETVVGESRGTVGLVTTDEGTRLLPAKLPTGVSIRIVYTVTNEGGCSDEATRTVRIEPLPVAEFERLPRVVELPAEPVPLVPVPEALDTGTFTAVAGGRDVSRFVLQEEGQQWLFVPEMLVELEFGFPVEVRIAYQVEGAGGCENRSGQRVIVERPDRSGGGGIVFEPPTDPSEPVLPGGGGVVRGGGGGFEVRLSDQPFRRLEASSETIRVLSDRRSTYAESLRAMAENEPGITDTKSYQLTNAFLAEGLERPANEAAAAYETLQSKIAPVYKRASGTRRELYRRMIELATRALLDRFAAEGTRAEHLAMTDRIRKVLREDGIDPGTIAGEWAAGETGGSISADTVDRFRTMLQ